MALRAERADPAAAAAEPAARSNSADLLAVCADIPCQPWWHARPTAGYPRRDLVVWPGGRRRGAAAGVPGVGQQLPQVQPAAGADAPPAPARPGAGPGVLWRVGDRLAGSAALIFV